ncbi:MAG: glycoside hydrolase family 38 C-terminal domain-containing protein [Candidatus Thorarchaeota archaeon]
MVDKKVIIVPHTHWDREWYLPFQRFRHMLVELIDDLLEILKQQDYRFMLDGQTVILEDYFEIRPERSEELLKLIRKGKITVGPWYVLPDQWLVGGESLIRNIEYSFDLATKLKIPSMKIGYLPDMFGHSSAIPQLFSDLTDFKTTVLWRGVPPDIVTVPFIWKSHPSSTSSIPGVYLPGGYGNVSRFVDDYKGFTEMVEKGISKLEPFSPVPVYLFMNGSDHLPPQSFVQEYSNRMKKEGLDISLGSLNDYFEELEKAISESNYTPPTHSGEFRSSARAPLLQDTYSARMWIKLWNQRVEDLLVRQAEPINTYLWLALKNNYPTSYLKTAWKWLLRNHPHDSICGCSVDSTHEEMKARFSWSESIGESLIQNSIKNIKDTAGESTESSILVFSSGGNLESPVYLEFSAVKDQKIEGLKAPDGTVYPVQRLASRDEIFFETTVGMRMAKMGINLLPGRKLMNFYINEVEYYDGDKPGLLEVRFVSDHQLIGDLDWEGFKQDTQELIASKRYKKVHIIAAKPTQNIYAAVIPMQPWSFTKLVPVESQSEFVTDELQVSDSQVSNRFYSVSFNKDGTLNIINKESGLRYEGLHMFEDYGDRGDEYTFGRVGPESVKVKNVKRHIVNSGPIVAEIKQEMEIEVFESLDPSREKRKGKAKIPVVSTFKFYRDTPRIEVKTRLTNKTKDHRLRVCFNLPFSSDVSHTATHFGVVERKGSPSAIPDSDELERTHSMFPEIPSGIQPQKRFIRVNDDIGNEAITVFNMGMPEVELVNSQRIAITLVRSIGWLSRSDFPERPIHAGPGEETPGAQELGEEYEYKYGFIVHSKGTPLHTSASHADAALENALVVSLDLNSVADELLEPIIQINNPTVRISSLRVRNEAVIVTMYNMESKEVEISAELADSIVTCEEVKIEGSTVKEHPINGKSTRLVFDPREIKMCVLKRAN